MFKLNKIFTAIFLQIFEIIFFQFQQLKEKILKKNIETKISKLTINEKKNRYKNILPCK